MYDIGIIGGMGSLATKLLFEKILLKSGATKDQDYPEIAILNRSKIPDRSAFLLGESSENPLPALLTAITELNALGARRIAIPCNTSHAFYEELSQAATGTLLNMPRLALEYIATAFPKARVCILGTCGTKKLGLYDRANDLGLSLLYPDEENQKAIHQLIYEIKADSSSPTQIQRDSLYQIMIQLQHESENGQGDNPLIFLLACTELSLFSPEAFPDLAVVDALDVLARACVEK